MRGIMNGKDIENVEDRFKILKRKMRVGFTRKVSFQPIPEGDNWTDCRNLEGKGTSGRRTLSIKDQK